MSIDKIPTEVLELIFSHLDGRSFAICSEVCALWRNVREDMLRIKNWWKTFCFNEIPKVTLQELCGDNSVYEDAFHYSDTKFVDWHKVYRQWFTSRRTIYKSVSVDKFASVESAPVTCCKLSGSWVLTGHRNGSVCAWNMKDGDMIRIVTQHLRMVTDFVLVDLLGIGPYSCTFHESTCSHQFAVSVGKDHNIQISSLLEDSYGLYYESQVIQRHSDSLESVRLFGDRFAVLCANNTLSVWLLVPGDSPCDTPTAQLLHFLTGPEEHVAWISFWNNQVGCLCKTGVLKTFDLRSQSWVRATQPQALYVEDSEGHTEATDYALVISSAHLFWNTIVFLITADYQLWVSGCGSTYTAYPTMERFQSYVLSLCFCGPLLALGLENGFLILFYIENPLQTSQQDLHKPIWQKRLSQASIIAIDIMLHERGPLLVAATTDSWVTVRWFDTEDA